MLKLMLNQLQRIINEHVIVNPLFGYNSKGNGVNLREMQKSLNLTLNLNLNLLLVLESRVRIKSKN